MNIQQKRRIISHGTVWCDSSTRFYCVAAMSFAFGCSACAYSGDIINTLRWRCFYCCQQFWLFPAIKSCGIAPTLFIDPTNLIQYRPQLLWDNLWTAQLCRTHIRWNNIWYVVWEQQNNHFSLQASLCLLLSQRSPAVRWNFSSKPKIFLIVRNVSFLIMNDFDLYWQSLYRAVRGMQRSET